jgi:hypothetical protein
MAIEVAARERAHDARDRGSPLVNDTVKHFLPAPAAL